MSQGRPMIPQGRPSDLLSLVPAQGRPRILRVDPQRVFFLCKFLLRFPLFVFGRCQMFKFTESVVLYLRDTWQHQDVSLNYIRTSLAKRCPTNQPRKEITAYGFHVPSSSRCRERSAIHEKRSPVSGSTSIF